MELPDFISHIQQQLKKPLPGSEAQLEMAPRIPYRFSKEEIQSFNPRKSAVLILIYFKNQLWHTVYVLRQLYEGVHSGQIGFPGGSYEPGDKDLEMTAIREVEEEIGIKKEHVFLIGSLTSLYIQPSGFLVYPFVAYYPLTPRFYLQESEIQQVIEVPLVHLCKPENRGIKKIKLSIGKVADTPYYLLPGNHILWGATAMISSELTKIVCPLLI